MKNEIMKNRKKINVPVLIGPTASGKTSLAIKIALAAGAEIISCDSRQIYKKMDIGTAKPSVEELAMVKHHLIDIIDPSESFSYADFSRLAVEKIDKIIASGKVPFVVGGTGFYLDGLVNGVSMIPELDESGARIMRDELELKETAELVSILRKLDLASASRIKFNDRQRLIRAIIVSRLSGAPFSSFKDVRQKKDNYNYLIFGLTKPRQLLYNDINSRVDDMFNRGLVDEVSNLLKNGYTILMPAMKTIGYQECVEYLQGRVSSIEMSELIKQHTRNYAKRQITYFKKFSSARWLEAAGTAGSKERNFEAILLEIKKIID